MVKSVDFGEAGITLKSNFVKPKSFLNLRPGYAVKRTYLPLNAFCKVLFRL